MAEDLEFDVAISFLSGDIKLAEKLRDMLVPGLNVFVYSRSQETVAAADGMQTFRTVFKDRARLSVVMFRAGWGTTPWTGVEETAIKERCLQTKYRSLVMVSLDGSPTPDWVPDTYVHFDYKTYSPQELAGVIKRGRRS